MDIGIFAKTFPGSTPQEVLKAAKASGYSSVQYNMACSGLGPLPETISAETSAAIRAASVETSVKIAVMSATYNMIHPNLEVRQQGRKSFAAIANAMEAMDCRIMTVCTGSMNAEDQWKAHPANGTARAWDEMRREFELLLGIAEQYDLQIGIEPEPANVVSSPLKARQLLDEFRSPRLGIILDPANLFEQATAVECRDLVEHAMELLHDDILLAHAKDRTADGRVVRVGNGVVDFPHFLRLLAQAGYHGAVITHGLDAADAEAEAVSRYLKQTLAAL